MIKSIFSQKLGDDIADLIQQFSHNKPHLTCHKCNAVVISLLIEKPVISNVPFQISMKNGVLIIQSKINPPKHFRLFNNLNTSKGTLISETDTQIKETPSEIEYINSGLFFENKYESYVMDRVYYMNKDTITCSVCRRDKKNLKRTYLKWKYHAGVGTHLHSD